MAPKDQTENDETSINEPTSQSDIDSQATDSFSAEGSDTTQPTTEGITGEAVTPDTAEESTQSDSPSSAPETAAASLPAEGTSPVANPETSFDSTTTSEPMSDAPVVDAVAPQVFQPTTSASPSEPTPVVSSAQSAASPVVPPTLFASSTPQVAPVMAGGPGGGKKHRSLFIGAVVALVVLLGGGYAFAFYLPNTPANVYKNGLSNTAKAYDKLTDYSVAASNKHYKGAKVSGTLQISADGIAGDGSFDFQNQGGNGTGGLKLDLAGQKLDANIRTVQPSGQKTPDLYFQATGIKSLLDNYGFTGLDQVEGKWISVDHTLLQSVAGSMTQETGGDLTNPTTDQVADALNKVSAVNKQYLFTSGGKDAVLKNQKYLGKSTQNGRSVYGYQVGYDKSNLQAYVTALSKALDSSKLNAWAKSVDNGKSISTYLNVDDLKSSVGRANADYTFLMYVDAKTKIIDKLHFTDSKSTDYFEFAQGYTGGSTYPFSFKVATGSGASDSSNLLMNLSINSVTDEANVSATFNGNSDGSATKVQISAKITPSNDAVKVTAPAGATSVNDLLGSLGLGGSEDQSSDPSAYDNSLLPDDYSSGLFTLTQ